MTKSWYAKGFDMFVLLSPQMVRHWTGYVVQVASRHRVELTERDDSIASAEAEFGPMSAIYAESICKQTADGTPMSLTEPQKVDLARRMHAGLEAVGVQNEIVWG